jgi:ribosomal protein L24
MNAKRVYVIRNGATVQRDGVVLVNSGTLKDVRGRVLRQSKSTGTLTVELLEDSGAYKKGVWVHVKPFECTTMMQARL